MTDSNQEASASAGSGKRKRGFQRARSDEHKAQRRAELLEAASALLEEVGVDGLSLSGLAKRAGLSKSNVYTYFESREDALLSLLFEDWRRWVDGAEVAMVPLAGRDDPGAVAKILAERYLAQPRLCELMSVLSSVLEQNVSAERIETFKRSTFPLGIRMANMLHVALPSLPFDRCVWVLKSLIAQVAGFWPLLNPPPNVAAVLAKPEFALHCVAKSDLQRSLRATLAGEMLLASE